MITIFLGTLSQKEDDFSWIINQVLRIFWFQALWKPHFENKRNFWINCGSLKSKAFVSWYTHKGAFAFIAYMQEDIHTMAYFQADIRIMAYSQGDIRIHYIHKGAFTSLHTHNGTIASRHIHKGHSHHGIHQWDIRIIAYLQGGIRIIAYSLSGHTHHSMHKRTPAS